MLRNQKTVKEVHDRETAKSTTVLECFAGTGEKNSILYNLIFYQKGGILMNTNTKLSRR